MRWIVALAAAAVFTVQGGVRRDRFVAVISIDGLAADDYVRPDRNAAPCGDIPTLQALMASGAWARGVAGVLPTVTYPAHATIATGAWPAKHGVVNNARLDGAPWHFDRGDIHATPLWDVAKQAGLTTAIVTWPSTMGADATYLIPENLSSTPTVTDLVRNGSTPGLFAALERATAPVALEPFSSATAGVPLDRMTASFAAEIVRRYKPQLLMLHFLDFDHRRHANGPRSPIACEALTAIDAHIARLRAAYRDAGIADRTAFVVVSDHGFEPLTTMVNLRRAIGAAADDFDVRIASGSAAYYAKAGVAASRAAEAAVSLKARIDAEYRGQIRWMGGDEAAALGGFPGAAFVLCAVSGHALTRALPPEAASGPSTDRGAHGYCPDEPGIDAGFIASGAGVRRAGAVARLPMIDVGPTIAKLLGLVLPDAQGIARADVLDPNPP